MFADKHKAVEGYFGLSASPHTNVIKSSVDRAIISSPCEALYPPFLPIEVHRTEGGGKLLTT